MTKIKTMTSAVFLFVALVFSPLDGQADWTKGRGDHVPFPYEAANRKVELADGEFYTLIGRVLVDLASESAYLHVDLERLPWLASKKRKEFPFYRLQGAAGQWSQYDGLRVRMNVQAITSGTEIIIKLIPLKKSRLTILD